jgi:hypothetical protein
MGEAEVARFSPEGPCTTCLAIRFISERLDMEGNSTKGSTKRSLRGKERFLLPATFHHNLYLLNRGEIGEPCVA